MYSKRWLNQQEAVKEPLQRIDHFQKQNLLKSKKKNLKAKLENRKKEKKEVEKKNSCYLKSLKDQEEEFMKKRGPFQERLRKVLEGLK